jgi:uncharacterized LabA/DUF88 family protein
LVLHAAKIEYDNYDQAVIVSNDGDFTCLIDFLNKQGKLRKILAPNHRYSSLFVPFLSKVTTLDKMRSALELKNRVAGIGGRSKP